MFANMVCVMMSTFNGERYIYEQINSIIKQNIDKLILLIRDDGSTDRTVNIIKSFYGELPSNRKIELIVGNNIGVERSFYELVYYARKNIAPCKYYAFSDQDDIWDCDKISTAIRYLDRMDMDTPNLYYSNLRVVDSELNFIRNKFDYGYVKDSTEFIAAEMCAWGCTCVFNFKALDEMSKIEYMHFLAHDNWILWLCAFCGECVYDEEPHILYRQHGNNVSGQVKFGVDKFVQYIKKISNIFSFRPEFEPRARLLLHLYNENLTASNRKILEQIAFYKKNFLSRIKLLFSMRISSGHIPKEIGRRIRIVLGDL